jgi:hypothetical protein
MQLERRGGDGSGDDDDDVGNVFFFGVVSSRRATVGGRGWAPARMATEAGKSAANVGAGGVNGSLCMHGTALREACAPFPDVV